MKVETRVVTKGQLVIPARLRRRFGIKKGTLVAFVEDDGHIIVQPVTPEFIRSLARLAERRTVRARSLAGRAQERPDPAARVALTLGFQSLGVFLAWC